MNVRGLNVKKPRIIVVFFANKRMAAVPNVGINAIKPGLPFHRESNEVNIGYRTNHLVILLRRIVLGF